MAHTAKEVVVRPSSRASRAALVWQSAIGKKALMAVTGVVLFAYVLGHLLGNLQVFAGPEAINRYAALLHVSPQLLWTVRVILLAALLVHVVAGVQLAWAAKAARPVGYSDFRPSASSIASRTMIWSGVLIFGFVVYHVLDLTIGVANPDFREGDVFHNLLATFGRVGAVIAYVVAMAGLGFHLWHGLWSVSQSLGFASRRAAPAIQRFAVTVAVLLTLGFSAIPVAVLLGFLR
jgi:succinate dehydrogenase / fumarate reductase, cytochrome b subunit